MRKVGSAAIDKPRVLRLISSLSKSMLLYPLAPGVVKLLRESLESVSTAVGSSAEFWEKWWEFHLLFDDIGINDSRNQVLTFYKSQLEKAIDSLRIAQSELPDKPSPEHFDSARSSMEELRTLISRNARASIDPCIGKVQSICKEMEDHLSPLFTSAGLDRYTHAFDCIDRVCVSMEGLQAANKINEALTGELNAIEEKLRQLVPVSTETTTTSGAQGRTAYRQGKKH